MDRYLPDIKALLAGFKTKSDEEIEEAERREQERERLARYRETVPRRYWDASFASFREEEQREAFAAAVEFARKVRSGEAANLLLLGSAGTGKTHLACAVLRECGGVYRLAAQLEDELQLARAFTSRDTPDDVLAKYGRMRLLVIDEAGRSDSGDTLYRVINARYNERKPTLIVSNMDKAGFAHYAGTAAIDRLAENSRTVELKGASYRLVLRERE